MNGQAQPQSGGAEGPLVERLGFAPEMIVQEFGFDDDTDEALRASIEALIGAELEFEDYTGETDAVLLWWRGDDGDLTDELVDMVSAVGDGGFILLLTPRPGRGVEVDPAEIQEASATAGLHSSGALNASDDWRAVRLVLPKAAGRR